MVAPIAHVEDGVVQAVKTATEPAQIERLRGERATLARIRHPGVVALVEHADDPQIAGTYRLATKHAGTTTLADQRPLGPDEIAGAMASVASTLADVHTLGVAHGQLGLHHVIVGPTGQTSICGWGDAQTSDDADLEWRLVAASDVEAIGTMIGELLDRTAKPGPRRRLLFSESTSSAASKLRTIAYQATDAEPTRRPTMRALASRLATALPGAHLPGAPPIAPLDLVDQPDPTAHAALSATPAADAPNGATERPNVGRPSQRPSSRWPVIAGIGSLILVVSLGTALFWPPTDSSTPEVEISATSTIAPPKAEPATTVQNAPTSSTTTVVATTLVATATTTTVAAAPATTTTVTAVLPTTTAVPCPAGDPEDPDIDGDGCPDRVIIDDNTVAIGPLVLEIGAKGGQIKLGDWDCDGRDTPASFHPATGLVAVFDDWATRETPVAARIVAEEAGATELSVRQQTSPACDQLVLRASDGALIPIDPMAVFAPLNK